MPDLESRLPGLQRKRKFADLRSNDRIDRDLPFPLKALAVTAHPSKMIRLHGLGAVPVNGSDLRQRLAAILAADAVGYSRLMSLDERATVNALDAARKVFRTHIESNQGRVIDMAGDSVLAIFETATGAVSAALMIQAEVNPLADAVPGDHRMRFRIGVHLGDVIEKADGTIYGDGVNIAARLEGLAEPGGMTVSDSIRIAVKGKVAAGFEDQGEQQIKNILDPVRAYRVRVEGVPIPTSAAAVKSFAPVAEFDLPLPDKPSIAVLPFTNMSGDPEQEYFTDGIAEDIITELSRFHSLFVIARNSSFTYKSKAVDVRTVAKELGVRYVLEGSIRRAGNRIRVTAQLIDASTGNHIWAEKYDRVLQDIFAVQEELTQAIVRAIAPQIESTELAKTARRRPGSLSAYEMALRAWAHAIDAMADASGVVAKLAIAEADQVLALDSDNTLALMAKACSYSCLLFFQIAPDPDLALREADLAATRAVASDHTNASALALRARTVLHSLEYDRYKEAVADARQAHDLNPNDTFVLMILVSLEAFGGAPEKAIDHGLLFLRLNPRDPKLHILHNNMCAACFACRRYSEGVQWGLRAIHDMPQMPQPHSNLAICYVGADEVEKARTVFAKLRVIAPRYAQSRLEGQSTQGRAEDRHRQHVFMRIAAGLDDPRTADALR